MRIKEVREAAEYMKKHGGEGGGTEVIANPELDGTEAALTGLQVGNTKYKVEAGGSSESLKIFKLVGEPDESGKVTNETDIATLEGVMTDYITNETIPLLIMAYEGESVVYNTLYCSGTNMSFMTAAAQPSGFEFYIIDIYKGNDGWYFNESMRKLTE